MSVEEKKEGIRKKERRKEDCGGERRKGEEEKQEKGQKRKWHSFPKGWTWFWGFLDEKYFQFSFSWLEIWCITSTVIWHFWVSTNEATGLWSQAHELLHSFLPHGRRKTRCGCLWTLVQVLCLAASPCPDLTLRHFLREALLGWPPTVTWFLLRVSYLWFPKDCLFIPTGGSLTKLYV